MREKRKMTKKQLQEKFDAALNEAAKKLGWDSYDCNRFRSQYASQKDTVRREYYIEKFCYQWGIGN
jgi:hypothetical protein